MKLRWHAFRRESKGQDGLGGTASHPLDCLAVDDALEQHHLVHVAQVCIVLQQHACGAAPQ